MNKYLSGFFAVVFLFIIIVGAIKSPPIRCNPGYKSYNGRCVMCPANTYSTYGISCTKCPIGKTSIAGSKYCK